MLYIFGIFYAALIVAGQTFYKYAVVKAAFEPSVSYLLSKKMLNFVFSWQFVTGVGLFVIASFLGFWMLTRFQFSTIQAVTVPIVMALSYVIGSWLFRDHITGINIIGLVILVIGVILASMK